jgi:hypothetical protein
MPHIKEHKLHALEANHLPKTVKIDEKLQSNWNGRQIQDLWQEGKKAGIFTSKSFQDFIRTCQLKTGLCFGQVHTLIGLTSETSDIKKLVKSFDKSHLPYSLQVAHSLERNLTNYLNHASVEKKDLDNFTLWLSTILHTLNLSKKHDRSVAKKGIKEIIKVKIADHKVQKTLIKKAKKILSYCKHHKIHTLDHKKLREKMTELSKTFVEEARTEAFEEIDTSRVLTPAMLATAKKLQSQFASIITKPLPTTILKYDINGFFDGKTASFKPKESSKEALEHFSTALADKKNDAILVLFSYKDVGAGHVTTLLPKLNNAYYDPNHKKIKELHSKDNAKDIIKEYLKTGVYKANHASLKIKKISFVPVQVQSTAI